MKTRRAGQTVNRVYQLPESFTDATREGLPPDVQDTMPRLCLETLQLCGLDLSNILEGATGFRFGFENLKILKSESCINLIRAFSLNSDATNSLKFPKLTTLSIRHERAPTDPHFRTFLEDFLTSLSGLTNLEVLVDQTMQFQRLDPILDTHGKTLRTLLWEERAKPRTSTEFDTSVHPPDLRNLRVIAHKCPYLRALALPLDWSIITGSNCTEERCKVRKI